MTTTSRTRLTLAACAAFAACSAFAQVPTPSAATAAPGTAARAQQEVANCDPAKQDMAACKREAGAAGLEARRGNLTTPTPGSAEANAMDRCKLQPAAEQADCMARARGPSAASATATGPAGTVSASQTTNVSGSVQGGGVIRETTTTTVVQPAAK